MNVTHPKFPGSRATTVNEDETVGDVADRIANEQGLEGTFTLSVGGDVLSRADEAPTDVEEAALVPASKKEQAAAASAPAAAAAKPAKGRGKK